MKLRAPDKETIFCKRDLYLEKAATRETGRSRARERKRDAER